MAVMPGLTGHLMAGLRIQEARRKNFRFAPSLLELLGLCPKPRRYGLLLHRLSLTASASGWCRLALGPSRSHGHGRPWFFRSCLLPATPFDGIGPAVFWGRSNGLVGTYINKRPEWSFCGVGLHVFIRPTPKISKTYPYAGTTSPAGMYQSQPSTAG